MKEIINADVVFYSMIAFMLFETMLEIYISRRQVRVYQTSTDVPPELVNVMDKETFEKARVYGLDKEQFGIFKAILMDVIVHTLEIYFGIIAHDWHRAEHIAVRLNLNPENEIIVSCLFLILISTISLVKDMPFKIYNTFVLEEKHGFNKQTAKFFIVEQIKEFIILQVLLTPVGAAVVFIVQHGGEHFFIWLWIFTAIVWFILITLYPNLIAPMFDTYTPLKDGPLKTSIEELAGSLKFPLKDIYVVDGSNRSAHSNAYFYGLTSSKRIVLFDTLLLNKGKDVSQLREEERGKGCTDGEILAILGHELGHWKLGHLKKNLVIKQVDLFLTFAIFGCLFQYDCFYEAVGFQTGEKPFLVGFIVMTYLMTPYNMLIQFGMTFLSRQFEYQADAFSVNLGYGKQMRSALIRTHSENLGFPVHDWLYVMWYHSHPTLLQRLQHVSEVEEEKKRN